MILLLDNYDSFTYNLLQYLAELGEEPMVRRNDQLSLDEIEEISPDKIVISPGPGRPEDAGISIEVVRRFGESIPTLGVCLGHQAVGVAYGGKIVRAPEPVHGKTSAIEHDGRGMFTGLDSPLVATRYHSLVVERSTLPDQLEVCAEVDGVIMALRHREFPVEGVQFHPESILTELGKKLLAGFIAQPIGSESG